MSWNTFLDTVVTRAAAVTGITYASRASSLDPERLLAIPAWPAVLVIDGGGLASQYDPITTERTMSIVIAVFEPAGTLGQFAAQTLGTLSERIVEEFTHTREDSSIRVLSESDEIAERIGAGEVYMRAINFEYEILRA